MQDFATCSKVVICGAGFSGVRAGLDLSRLLPDCSITLIDQNPYHCYTPDLYEVAAAVLKKETKAEFKNLAGTVNIPLKKIFAGKKNVTLVTSRIERIDLDKKEVKTKNNHFSYDFLVLALGSEANYYGIAGAQEYSHPLKSAENALNIRDDLEELIREKGKNIEVVIAGGGFSGVELAGELSEFLPAQARLVILEREKSILTGMGSWAQEVAAKRLHNLGVRVLTEHSIKCVEKDKVLLDSGKTVRFDYLIWTTGVTGRMQDSIAGARFNEKGKLDVEADLSLEKHPEVFVAGDLVEFGGKDGREPVPAVGWAAVSEAETVAKNLAFRLSGKGTKTYLPKKPAFVVPVGGKFALTDVFGLKLTGFVAWIIKRLVSLKYMLSLLPFFEALMVFWREVEIYTKNDER